MEEAGGGSWRSCGVKIEKKKKISKFMFEDVFE